MRIRSLTSVVPALFVGACVAADEPTTDDVSQAVGPKAPCDEPYCGNSPKSGGLSVDELDETGVKFNESGVRITNFFGPGGATLKLNVDKLVLWGKRADGVVVFPPALGGAKIQLQTNEPMPRTFMLTLGTPVMEEFYEGRDDNTTHPTFPITYVDVTDPYTTHNLCGPDGPHTPRVLFFQGDRYNSHTGDVIASDAAADPWFNLACQDDARWKAVHTGYSGATEDGTLAHHTTAPEREAALRSIRADYCGIGYPFTKLGTAIDWEDRHGFWILDNVPAAEPIEAIWTDAGAVCLSYPRLWKTVTINETCVPPPCEDLDDDIDANWATYGFIQTRNP